MFKYLLYLNIFNEGKNWWCPRKWNTIYLKLLLKMIYCTIQLVFLCLWSSVYTESGPCWIRLTMLPFSRWTGQRALASLPGLKMLLSSGGT
jgi:hypothetical protein